LQADHVPTVKPIGGHLKKSLFSSRRKSKASGAAQQEEAGMAFAKQWWPWRWSLLKKPGHVAIEDKQALAELENEDAGFVDSFRRMIRRLVTRFDQAHSEAQAQHRRQQRRQEIHALADPHREKMPQGFDDHWEQALRYLRNKGMGTPKRGSHSASGRRLLRRLEKNHDGIRSAATRQHYIQIYQAMTYLSLDVTDFIEQGPQMAALACV
jgi:hypothetical protein